MKKICGVCKKEKFLPSFKPDPNTRDGLTNDCIKCRGSKQIDYGQVSRIYATYRNWENRIKELEKMCSFFKTQEDREAMYYEKRWQ